MVSYDFALLAILAFFVYIAPILERKYNIRNYVKFYIYLGLFVFLFSLFLFTDYNFSRTMAGLLIIMLIYIFQLIWDPEEHRLK